MTDTVYPGTLAHNRAVAARLDHGHLAITGT